MQVVHILNGDSLAEKFPTSLLGEVIVARECLMVGDVSGDNLDAFWANRAAVLQKSYGVASTDYYIKSVSEFERVGAIRPETTIACWFEDDLFCQINFWFVTHLIKAQKHHGKVCWVRPTKGLEQGFGGMDEYELVEAYQQRKEISPKALEALSLLWGLYVKNENERMLSVAKELATEHPTVLPAVRAQLERAPLGMLAGRPYQSLRAIMAELGAHNFDAVFKAFSKKESIYGFGDLQVKAMFDELKKM